MDPGDKKLLRFERQTHFIIEMRSTQTFKIKVQMEKGKNQYQVQSHQTLIGKRTFLNGQRELFFRFYATVMWAT